MQEIITGTASGKRRFFKKVPFISTTLFVAIVGTTMLLLTHAQGTSTITGYIFQDVNRNGVMDTGDMPMSGVSVYASGPSFSLASSAVTDSTGKFTYTGLTDGDYSIWITAVSWATLQNGWISTTIPYSADTGESAQQTVHVAGEGTVNFGLRPITRSTDPTKPLSVFTAPSGMTCKSYNDAVTAQDWCTTAINLGSLASGPEAKTQTLIFDYPNSTATEEVTSVSGNAPGAYSGFSSTSWISFTAWLGAGNGGSEVFWHEYGHAWSYYNQYITNQADNFDNYLKARGLYGDPRLYSDKTWSPNEMVAEDYRRLFGSPHAQLVPVALNSNYGLPEPEDVAGLKDWMQNTFTKPPASAIVAPTGLVANAVSQSEIDLNWSIAAGAVKYHIYNATGTEVGFTNAPSTTFASVNLTPNTKYSYYVKAENSNGQLSGASTTVSATTKNLDGQAPTSPTSLTGKNITSSSVTLAWGASTDNVGISGYRIYQVGGTRKSTFNTLVASTTATNYTVSGLSPASGYSYYVVAYDAAGNQSQPSNTLNVKTLRH